MDTALARKFITDEIKPLWSDWRPTEPEVNVWLNFLADFTWDEAKQAVQAYYQQQGSGHRRPRPHCLAKQRPAVGRRSDHQDPKADLCVACIKPPKERPALRGHRKLVFALRQGRLSNDPDDVRKAAEVMRIRCGFLYGGDWEIQRAPTPERRGDDDGLHGNAARHEAEQEILAGPDTPGRRFLLALRRGKRLDVLKTVDEAIKSPPGRPKPPKPAMSKPKPVTVAVNEPLDDIPF